VYLREETTHVDECEIDFLCSVEISKAAPDSFVITSRVGLRELNAEPQDIPVNKLNYEATFILMVTVRCFGLLLQLPYKLRSTLSRSAHLISIRTDRSIVTVTSRLVLVSKLPEKPNTRNAKVANVESRGRIQL
jgi:hypothetical protein